MTILAALALLAWVWLLLARGGWWRAGPQLAPASPAVTPSVTAVVPARDEADVIAASLSSLLGQDYAGAFEVVVVDDGSADGTAEQARAAAGGAAGRLRVLAGAPRPLGWAGKLWAVQQGVAASAAEWLLLTDADIVHAPAHLATLLAKAERDGLDLVSEMVALNCTAPAERALVPAFVYFFQLLYPFAWVNDPAARTAAAAGGTILIRRAALEAAGGIGAIRGALIDDVALARAVKASGGRIWLGHSGLARSIRRYPTFADIWRMIARSAYVQLRYSPLLLLATLIGLALLFLVPPLAVVLGPLPARLAGAAAWALFAASLLPSLRRAGCSPLWAPLLPAMAAFYMAATLGAAVDYHRGRGVRWKRRAYAEPQA